MERRGGEELNLKGREDQNGAKLAEVQRLHTREHKRDVGGIQIQRPSPNGHEVGLTDP